MVVCGVGVEDRNAVVCRQELVGSPEGKFHPYCVCYKGFLVAVT